MLVIVIIFFDSEKSTLAPNETKRSFIVCTSFTNGTFLRVILFLNKIDAAINGRQEFLAPLIFKFTIWLQGPLTWEEFIGGESFTGWIRYSKSTDNIDVGGIMQTLGTVSASERVGYEAPYPNATYKAGAQIFPYLIPSELRKNEKAYRDVFEKWDKPFLIANSDNDPVTSNNPRLVEMLKRVPTAEEIVIKGPGHFIQEEAGPEYAQLIIDFINGNPKGFSVEKKLDNFLNLD